MNEEQAEAVEVLYASDSKACKLTAKDVQLKKDLSCKNTLKTNQIEYLQ